MTKLTASQVLKELLDYLHVTGDLLASHLLDAIVAIVDTEDLLATKDGHANDKDVLADEHVTPMKLSTHRELATTHVRHQENSLYTCQPVLLFA